MQAPAPCKQFHQASSSTRHRRLVPNPLCACMPWFLRIEVRPILNRFVDLYNKLCAGPMNVTGLRKVTSLRASQNIGIYRTGATGTRKCHYRPAQRHWAFKNAGTGLLRRHWAFENAVTALLGRHWPLENAVMGLLECHWALENPGAGLLKTRSVVAGLPFFDTSYCKYG